MNSSLPIWIVSDLISILYSYVSSLLSKVFVIIIIFFINKTNQSLGTCQMLLIKLKLSLLSLGRKQKSSLRKWKTLEIKVLLSTHSETIAKLNILIVQHELTISILRNDVDVLLKEKSALHKRCDEMEAKIERCNVAFDQKLESLQQYTIRQLLHIDRIKLNEVTDPDKSVEKSENVVTIFSRLMNAAGLKDPASVIDRAHRIGRTYINNGNQCKRIIVKFNNFRVRTALYRKRKSLTDKNVRILQKKDIIFCRVFKS